MQFKKVGVLVIIVVGGWQLGSGYYIYGKAQLAQYLLRIAWAKTLESKTIVKPWKWADTYPVANISFKNKNNNFIVLAGGTGRTMAFGPGHISSSPLPGNGGNSVIVGHRDTHFAVLEDLKLGDEVYVQTANQQTRYTIYNTMIIDQSRSDVMQDFNSELLTLITCYPFDTIHPGGSLRYVVQAIPL